MEPAPIHPGEILHIEFIEPLGISQYRLAKSISVPPRRINEIVHGTRSITADTALRLARFFDTSAQFWLSLQSHYDLESRRITCADDLKKIKPLDTTLETGLKGEPATTNTFLAMPDGEDVEFNPEKKLGVTARIAGL